MPARSRDHSRALRLVVAQPILTVVARWNARARELAAAMRLPCTACGASLASHVGVGNRWKGCHTPGPNTIEGFAAALNPAEGALAEPLPFSLTAEPCAQPAKDGAQRYLFVEDGEPCE